MSLEFTLNKDDNDNYTFHGSEQGYTGIIGKLSPFPGSETIWISHSLYVPPTERRKGFAKEYNQRMLEHAWFILDASAVVCSVKQDNHIQHDRLNKLGWEPISRALWIIRPPTEWTNT